MSKHGRVLSCHDNAVENTIDHTFAQVLISEVDTQILPRVLLSLPVGWIGIDQETVYGTDHTVAQLAQVMPRLCTMDEYRQLVLNVSLMADTPLYVYPSYKHLVTNKSRRCVCLLQLNHLQ